jgi:hypothetical protein
MNPKSLLRADPLFGQPAPDNTSDLRYNNTTLGSDGSTHQNGYLISKTDAMATLVIKSPKATQIKTIAHSGLIKAGAVLIELFDFEERKTLSTIQRAIEENSSKLEEITGPRVAEKIAHLAEISNQRLKALTPTQNNYEVLRIYAAMGTLGKYLPIKAQHFVAMRTYQKLQASVELEIYRRNIADSTGVLTVINDLLQKEKEYMRSICDRLSIKAPKDGRFTALVAVGDPVPVGYPLGEIE